MEPSMRRLEALRAPDTMVTSVEVTTNSAGGLTGSPASPAAFREDTTAPILVQTLDDMSLARVTRAELQAWGTLMHSHGETSRDRLIHSGSGKIDTLRGSDGARPSSAKIARGIDPLFDALERLGPAATSTTVSHSARLGRAAGFVGQTDRATCADPKRRRPSSASAVRSSLFTREIDACRAALAENLESRHRKDTGQHRCSEISVRFLREYAMKEQQEDKAFHRALKAEARALEERHVENIHRSTKRSRDLEQSAIYLPHRVRGVLHVLKVHTCHKSRFDRGEQGSSGRSLVDYGKVMSVDYFMKTEHARTTRVSPEDRTHNGDPTRTRLVDNFISSFGIPPVWWRCLPLRLSSSNVRVGISANPKAKTPSSEIMGKIYAFGTHQREMVQQPLDSLDAERLLCDIPGMLRVRTSAA